MYLDLVHEKIVELQAEIINSLVEMLGKFSSYTKKYHRRCPSTWLTASRSRLRRKRREEGRHQRKHRYRCRKGKTKLFQHFASVIFPLPQAALLLQQQQQAAAQVQGVKLSAAGVGAAAAAVEKQLKRMPSSGQVRHSNTIFVFVF